jgi:hypothetical protein
MIKDSLTDKLRSLLREAAETGFWEPAVSLVAADFLDEHGHDELAAKLRRDPREGHEVYRECLQRGLLRYEDEPAQQLALAFEAALAAVDLARVKDRSGQVGGRGWGVALANAIRQLLRDYGFPRIPIRAGRRTVCSSVYVTVPRRLDEDVRGGDRNLRFRLLLAAAFPEEVETRGYSDSFGDYVIEHPFEDPRFRHIWVDDTNYLFGPFFRNKARARRKALKEPEAQQKAQRKARLAELKAEMAQALRPREGQRAEGGEA